MNKGLVLFALILFLSPAFGGAHAQTQEKPVKSVPKMTTDDAISPPIVRSVGDEDTKSSNRETAEYSGGPISWENDLARARELASYKKGVIIVDVYTDWCQWCHKMDQVIYSSPKVAALSANNVFVKLNAEDGGQGAEFATQAGVTGFPTTFILDGEGHTLQVLAGYISQPDSFVKLVEKARSAISQ